MVSLDYTTFTPNISNTCDVFRDLIAVQNILHETKKGDVTKNASQKALELKFDYNGGSTNQKGTEFAISGTFKKDYKYTVKITAKNNSTYDTPAGLKCNFDPFGVDPACDGLKLIDPNNGTFSSSSSNWFKIVNGSTDFSEYTFESDYLSSNRFSLGIGTFSPSSVNIVSRFQTMYIKKIQIFEIPPPPSFTLAPTTVALPCGNTSSRVFTVTPANVPSGAVVTYQWSHNGWSQISATATSKTLQPNSDTTLPSSVTVTAILNGVAQPTRTATVSRSAITSSATISGSSTVCSSATYTMTGLLSGQTVSSWTVSNPSRATLSATSGATTTVTKISNGQVTLTATIRNACNQTVTKPINLQLGNIMDFTWNGVGPFGQLDVNVTSGSAPFKVYRGTTLLYSGSDRYPTVNFGCNGGVLKVEASTPCGTASKTVIVPSGCASFRGQRTMVVFPNPSSSEINVAQIDKFKEARSDESFGAVTLELYNFNSP